MNVRSLPAKALSLFVSGCLAFSLAGFALPELAFADEQADQQLSAGEEPAETTDVQQEPQPEIQDPALQDQEVQQPVQPEQPAQDVQEPQDSQEPQEQLASESDQPEASDSEEDQPEELQDGLQQDEHGNWIYLESGVPVTQDFRNVAEGSSLDGRYYFDANGFAVSGLQTINGKLYYFDTTTFKAVKKAWKDIDGKRYRFGANYYALDEGRYVIGGKLYYIGKNHAVHYGWKTWQDGTKSYFSTKRNGAAAKEWWVIGGKRYYFHKETAKAYRGLWWIDGKRYYFNKANSRQYKGWKKWASGRRSYFSPKHNGAAASGWWTIKGKRYYFNPDTRKTVRGIYVINGKRYGFKDNGVMRTNWYQWPNGKWSYFGKNGVQRMGVKYLYGLKFNFVNGKARISDLVRFNMCRKAQQYTSPTGWLILVDLRNQHMTVFSGSKGNWILKKYWICSSGMPGITATVASANHAIGYRGYAFGDETFVCYWYTQFFKRCLFHSSPYIPGTSICMDSTMGVPSSRGCIRLRIDRAKWIHDNMPRDTRVVVFGRLR